MIKIFFIPIIFLVAFGLIWQICDQSAADRGDGFFQYRFRIDPIHNVPYWLVALGLQFIINGLFWIKWMLLKVNWGSKGFDVSIHPVKLIGLQLILVPLLTFLQIVVRTYNI